MFGYSVIREILRLYRKEKLWNYINSKHMIIEILYISITYSVILHLMFM